jgi:Nickel responsive protein SCO4226-like
MPRYLVERDYGPAEQEAMQNIGLRSKQAAETLRDVTWDHSHVVSDETVVKSYCVYEAPDEERLREHGDMVGEHTIVRIYEIAGDVTPADFTT